jgi:hypothetical protein
MTKCLTVSLFLFNRFVRVAWRGGSTADQQGTLCAIEELEVIDRPFDLSGFVKRAAADSTREHDDQVHPHIDSPHVSAVPAVCGARAAIHSMFCLLDMVQAGVVVGVRLAYDVAQLDSDDLKVRTDVPAERLRRLNQYDGAVVVDTANGRLAKVSA